MNENNEKMSDQSAKLPEPGAFVREMLRQDRRVAAVEVVFAAHVRRIHAALVRNKQAFIDTPGHGQALLTTLSGPSEQDVDAVVALMNRAELEGRQAGVRDETQRRLRAELDARREAAAREIEAALAKKAAQQAARQARAKKRRR